MRGLAEIDAKSNAADWLDQFSTASALNDNNYRVIDDMLKPNDQLKVSKAEIAGLLKSAHDLYKSTPSAAVGGKSELDDINEEFIAPIKGAPEAVVKIPTDLAVPDAITAVSGSQDDVVRKLYEQNAKLMELLKGGDPEEIKTATEKMANEIEKSPDMMSPTEYNTKLATTLMTIKNLRANMAHTGFKMDNIPDDIMETTDLTKARTVLTQLNACWQAHMWGNIVQEAIIKAAGVIEKVFDGKREIAGVVVNMDGWSGTVATLVNANTATITRFVGSHIPTDDYSDLKTFAMQIAMSAVMHQSAGSNVGGGQAINNAYSTPP
ncbi:MAG: hypothetical protein CMK92_04835 [Pseudomonas sp.]|nr:hypothetical protein [Pseudomonas sp.]